MDMPENYYDWLDFWLEFYHKPKVKPDTYQCTFHYLKILKSHSFNIKLKDIDEFYCQSILNKMYDGGYAKATIKKVNTIIRQSMMRARRNQLMFQDPTEFLIIPQAPIKKVEALTVEEQKIVEQACKQDTLGHLIIFMLNTGLRRSEVINLKWSNFNKRDKEITITKSKTENGIRTIPLLNKAYNVILSQKKSTDDDFIFHGHLGTKLTNSIMKKLYEKIREETGINTFTNHVCRHTFATRLIEYGASPKSVATLLGHSKVEYALNIYTNLEKKHVRKEIFLLEPQNK